MKKFSKESYLESPSKFDIKVVMRDLSNGDGIISSEKLGEKI